MDQELIVIYCDDCGRIIEDSVGLGELEILDILNQAELDGASLRCEECDLSYHDYDCGIDRV